MATRQGVIEGAVSRMSGGLMSVDDVGYGPYPSAGVPASGFLNNVCQKGGLVIDTTGGGLYSNTGTLAATVWTAR
jgi:hypothetical protein